MMRAVGMCKYVSVG